MRIAIACSLVLGALALLPWDAAAQFAEKKVLTLGIARKIVAAAESEPHALISLASSPWSMTACGRSWMSACTTRPMSPELAFGKARTAALFKKPSQQVLLCDAERRLIGPGSLSVVPIVQTARQAGNISQIPATYN